MPNLQNLARPVFSKSADVLYSQTTSVRLMTLPRTARIIRVTAYSQAASAGATLSLGIASDDNYYVSALDVSAEGVAQAALLIADRITTAQDLYVMIGGTPPSGGPFTVIVEFDTSRSRGPV